MNQVPQAITEAEIKELAACTDIQDAYGEAGIELEQLLQDTYIAKFDRYITDGPGYSGPVFVILSGDLNTLLVIKNGDGWKITPQEY
jgi:hypothetical protein